MIVVDTNIIVQNLDIPCISEGKRLLRTFPDTAFSMAAFAELHE